MIEEAIQWIHNHTISDSGIMISSKQRTAYPEVTGYFIPTLLSIGEKNLAEQFAAWLLSTQLPDGAIGLKDEAYAFDSGQVIRGWIALVERIPGLEQPLRNLCDWIVNSSDSYNGRIQIPEPGKAWSLGNRGEVNEAIHLYVLWPILQAGKILNEKKYIDFARKSRDYYLNNCSLTDFQLPNSLTHFYAYIQEALLELECEDVARAGMKAIAPFQQPTGAVPAYSNVQWVCTPGLAQLAQVWYRLGEHKQADQAMKFLGQLQNPSGGFFGSYGFKAEYFPAEEISWAVKYAIEASQHQISSHFDQTAEIYTSEITQTDGRAQALIRHLGDLSGKRVLDAGAGKGRYSKLLKERYPDADITALDVSNEMLKHIPEGIRKVQHGILDMPFEDGWFDAVICIEALEHVVQYPKGVAELCRVLAQDGRIVIIDKNKKLLGALEMPHWEKWFDRQEILDLLALNRIDADSELIAYDNHSSADGLFICWVGKKLP